MGQGRRRRRALHPAGPPGDGAVARSRRHHVSASGSTSAATVLVEGRAIGQKIGAGAVRVLHLASSRCTSSRPGEVLVADMTDPDWEPIMKRAAAIVTNRGGRTCHAAIIARELGIPAVVGTGAGDPRRWPTASRSPCPAPRATPASSTPGMLDFTVERDRAGDDARHPGQDHDERRHPGPGVRVLPAAERRASGWPGWSSSSTGRSASTPRRCSSFDTLDRPLRDQIAETDRRVRRARGTTSCSGSPRACRCWRPRSRRTR